MTDLQKAPAKFIEGAPSALIDIWFSREHQHWYFLLDDEYRTDTDRHEKKLCMLAAVRMADGSYRVSKTRRGAGPRPTHDRRIWLLLPEGLRIAVGMELLQHWTQLSKEAGAIMDHHQQEKSWH